MFEAAVDEAGESGVIADAEADEGLGIAPGAKGTDGVDNLLGGDALAAEAEENDGGEEAARDQGGKEGQEDEEDDEGVDLETEKMIEQGDVHTGNARRVCPVGEPTRRELVDAKGQLPRETVGFVFEKIGRKRADEVAGLLDGVGADQAENGVGVALDDVEIGDGAVRIDVETDDDPVDTDLGHGLLDLVVPAGADGEVELMELS